jgi:hypothetical protein
VKRISFDDSKDQSINSSVESYLPCSFCGKATLTATLSQYGARCAKCFDTYCQEVSAPTLADERVAVARKLIGLSAAWNKVGGSDPRQWAHDLRNREQSGERLSRFQRDAWREAIGDAQ